MYVQSNVFDKRAQNTQRKKSSLFSKRSVVGKLDVHTQKNEIGPLTYTAQNMNLKLTTDLKVRPETPKPLDENRKKSLTLFLATMFLDMTRKHRHRSTTKCLGLLKA